MATHATLVLIEVPEKERDILNLQDGGWAWTWYFHLVTTQPFCNPDNGRPWPENGPNGHKKDEY
jgi:hypothetical protein